MVGAIREDALETVAGLVPILHPESGQPFCVQSLQFLFEFLVHIGNGFVCRGLSGLQCFGDFENDALRCAHVEHRRAPLDIITPGKNGLARLRDGRIHRETICYRAVKFLCKRDGRRFEDLELHGNHCRDTLQHQRLCHTCVRIFLRGARSFTSVQNHQSQRTVVMQDCPQVLTADWSPPAIFIFQQEHTILFVFGEFTMPNEVKDVIFSSAKILLQGTQCGVLQPLQIDQATMNEWR